MVEMQTEKLQDVQCYHCGDSCSGNLILFEDRPFCCGGCKAIYQLFQDSDLNDFYQNRETLDADKFDYLNNEEISNTFIRLKTDNFYKIELSLPAIHCSSCLYVLENLPKVDNSILSVTVNFSKKTADILYNPNKTTLASICTLLASIGYTPDLSKKEFSKGKSDQSLAIKIGVAGFCFGNIMLISFPEYLGIDMQEDISFTRFFGWVSIVLSLPVLFYSGAGYFKSAYNGLRSRFINIDIPIALGMIVLFLRSFYEITFSIGAGYLDSLAGLVFFLLIGRWFQSKTYEELSFDRDYKSYFPLSIIRLKNNIESATPINELQPNDEIVIRNSEIVPTDSILLNTEASIDYSFVTGEQEAVKVYKDQVVYAGGRLIGTKVKMKVVSKSSQSYLTSLWNNQVFKNEKHSASEELTNQISKHFTLAVLTIAALGAMYWYVIDPNEIWQVVTAVLIVACPCALALSAPFTNGNTIRILGRNGLYLKKASVSEKLPEIDTIIFDKTGTITNQKSKEASFIGSMLNDEMLSIIKTMTSNSTHPLSQIIYQGIEQGETTINGFNEVSGKGLECYANDVCYKLGSSDWVGAKVGDKSINKTRVYFGAYDECLGYFEIIHNYRKGIKELVQELGKTKKLMVVSGDNDSEQAILEQFFPVNTVYHFDQKPEDKLCIISKLQKEGRKVMMLGDGLNDAGALKQSDIGIAVTDDVSSFSPACDGIIQGNKLVELSNFLGFALKSKYIIYKSFGISLLYNVGGVSLALAGLMIPIAAAILMPVSSISVVLFTTLSGNYIANKLKL